MKLSTIKKSLLVLSLLSIFSCEKAEDATPSNQSSEKSQVEKMLPLIKNQYKGQQAIQQIIIMAQELKGKYIPNGKVGAEANEMAIYSEIPTCAKVNPDLKNKTISVDFGTSGCTMPSGKSISGQLILSVVSPSIKVEMKNFVYDGTTLNGSLELSGLYAKTTNPEVIAKLLNLQVTTDGKTSTYSLDMKMKWNAGFTTTDNKDDDDILSALNGTMMVSDGTYEIVTNKEIHTKGTCSYPLAGNMSFKKADSITTSIDFGNDTCDDKATITAGSYVKEVDLDDMK